MEKVKKSPIWLRPSQEAVLVRWEGGCAQYGVFHRVARRGWALLVVSGVSQTGIARIVSSPGSVGGGNVPWFGTPR